MPHECIQAKTPELNDQCRGFAFNAVHIARLQLYADLFTVVFHSAECCGLVVSTADKVADDDNVESA